MAAWILAAFNLRRRGRAGRRHVLDPEQGRVYAVLRLWLLLGGAAGAELLLYGGMATIAYGVSGMLAAQTLGRLAGFNLIVSSGTLLAAIGAGQAAATGAALYYLLVSTLGSAAFFLLIELVERARTPGADVLAVTAAAFGVGDEETEPEEETGVAIPATMALLGLSFACCALLAAGLPPLPGFLAKFALLAALLAPIRCRGSRGPCSSCSRCLALPRSLPWDARRAHLLGHGDEPAARAPDRDGTGRRLARALPRADRGRRARDELPQRHRARAARAGRIHRERAYAMRRWLPYPILSLALAAAWLVLNRSVDAAHILLGAALGLAGGRVLAALQPPHRRPRRAAVALELFFLVLADIVRSNIAVARIVLNPGQERTAGFLSLPLELRHPAGLAAVACIVTATPERAGRATTRRATSSPSTCSTSSTKTSGCVFSSSATSGDCGRFSNERRSAGRHPYGRPGLPRARDGVRALPPAARPARAGPRACARHALRERDASCSRSASARPPRFTSRPRSSSA